jgi:hypothetical protein
MYDPEIPAGYQDADIEQAEMEALGNHIHRLEARGVCTHGAVVGHAINPDTGETYYYEQEYIEPGQKLCHGCGSVFVDEQDWQDAREVAIYGG